MIASAQYTIGTTAVKISSTSDTPKHVYIHAESSATVYVGTSTVTGSTGLLIDKAGGPVMIQLDPNDELWAIAKSGTHTTTVLEVFL